MTIRAKQPDVLGVCGPVFEAALPSVAAVFGPKFGSWIYMVYVDCSMIGKAALRTFAAKLSNQVKFSFPVTGFFVNCVSMRVPVRLLATRGAKPRFGFLPASLAFPVIRPAVSQITSPAAELSGSILEPIRVHLGRLVAVLTGDFNRRCSHWLIISETRKRKYFDIACERIKAAYAQGRLFA